MMNKTGIKSASHDSLTLVKIEKKNKFPGWAGREEVVSFLHEKMKPYEDKVEDIERALDYAFSEEDGKGGFILLMRYDNALAGVLTILKTGMKGYIPENILVFVSVDPRLRGKGLGRKLIERAIDECEGDIKLHVEYDNPARRLYERIGFTSKYAEMRYTK
jgi:ribosomal-protein-alanine N-acetyltransferase